MAEPLLFVEHLLKQYGDKVILNDINLTVNKGEVVVIEESFGVRIMEIIK